MRQPPLSPTLRPAPRTAAGTARSWNSGWGYRVSLLIRQVSIIAAGGAALLRGCGWATQHANQTPTTSPSQQEELAECSDAQFDAAYSAFVSDFRRAQTAYDRLLSSWDAHQLTDDQFAAEIRRQVLPTTQQARNSLLRIRLRPGSPRQPLLELSIAYARERSDAFRLYAEALESQDNEKVKTAGSLMQHASALVPELDRRARNGPASP